MRNAKKNGWSDRWIGFLLYGSILLIALLPFLTSYDAIQKGWDLRDQDSESWMGFAHAGYILFSLLAMFGLVAVFRGKVASERLSSRKKLIVNIVAGATLAGYSIPLWVFLIRVDGYFWVVLRSVWDFISEAL